ncbi:hypothetical protein AC482_07415 [miscellaneous Crenarchaeota group-15 archaeon DG-45]|uniref:DNA repair protein n=1 Tax=miscellaneous Crenarchaeota group-15 archaeon DG-45 TaxID=1685127 RepID=A0A0M0BKB6_9ARCH|nr:MAG: hypothetical protein AC482_07415 [miscellaneous Crenarchaeota group-15 archaeon DG-45]
MGLIYTIGHSTRTLGEFLSLLGERGIETLVDVRRWPTSKRCPHFNRESLSEALAEEGIRYIWLGESLGGYRREGLGEASPNGAWRSEGFRNYADHALSEDFRGGLEELIRLAGAGRTACMCAERHWWRCHRRIISDHLVARGVEVIHIVDGDETRRHELSPSAVFSDGVLTYPPRKKGATTLEAHWDR